MGSRVKMLWFLFPFGGLIIGAYVSTPKLKRRGAEDPVGLTAGGSESAEGAWVVDQEKPWYWRLDNLGVIAVATSLCVVWTFMPTRFVTRLALVKRYPTNTPVGSVAQTSEFLRIQHGGHLMALVEKAPMRDLPVSDVAVKAIGRPGATSFLNLKVTPGGKKSRVGLDAMGYRLDFRDTKLIKSTTDEVVLSLNRIEHVFGSLR